MAPRKSKPEESLNLTNPILTEIQMGKFHIGVALFNDGKYWDAHEAWEEIWQELGNGSENDWEIILRGLIQFAAGLYGCSSGKKTEGRGNLKKAAEKLNLFKEQFVTVDIEKIVLDINKKMNHPPSLLEYQLPVKKN
tara:strand:+ start:2587 stop:2997 length:411 start_codon:yes stop_codon:yes gene_type:complete